MANENGEWIMYGMDWNDPMRIRSWRDLIKLDQAQLVEPYQSSKK